VTADQLGHHRELAPRYLDAGTLRSCLQAATDRLEDRRVGLLDRYVVHEGDRRGADADEVVDIHRHAVDPDGVEAAHLLGDDELRPHAVGADRDRGLLVEGEHAGVMTGRHDLARRASGVDRRQDRDERRGCPRGLPGVDPGGGIGVARLRHEAIE
jgi:hypothetical protein